MRQTTYKYCPNCDQRLSPTYERGEYWVSCYHCHISWHISYWDKLPSNPLGPMVRGQAWHNAWNNRT